MEHSMVFSSQVTRRVVALVIAVTLGFSVTIAGIPRGVVQFPFKIAAQPTALQSNLISDDFNDTTLNAGLWTYVNPLGDATLKMNGSEAKFSVPGGTAHDAWTGGNNVPRIMQPTLNTDLQIIVKIDSPMTQQYQTSGILVQESPTTYLRFDIHSDGTNLKAFAASIQNNVATSQIGDVTVDTNGVVPVYIAVNRSGNVWQMATSKDGSTWSLATTFTYSLSVSAAGIFIANQGTVPPPFTGAFDYFQTNIPNQPTLVLPSNGAVGVPLSSQLVWATFPGAVTYRVQAATDSGFATGLVMDDSTVVDTTKSLSGLSYSTQYYWRVSAKNASGAISSFTHPWTFNTIVAPPSTPVLVSPATNSANMPLSVLLRWRKASGATGYHLQAGTDSLFASGIVLNDSSLTDTSHTLTGLINETKYYWRVLASGPGGLSAYSVPWSFTSIIDTPEVPVLAAPADGVIDIPVSTQLRWHPALRASQYIVKIGTDSTFFFNVLINDTTGADTVLSVTGLPNGTRLFWRVAARNIGGTSAPSAYSRFTTIVGPPVIVYPANGSSGLPLTLSLLWRTVKSADHYWLQFGTDSTFASGLIKNDSTITDTSRSIIGLVINTRYYWRVNARGAGSWSGFSSTASFLTATPLPPAVTLISPANNAILDADSARFVWQSAQPLIEAYELDYGPDSTFVFSLIDTAIVDTAKSVKGLLNNTRYFWRVRAKNPGGWGPYSTPIWAFEVIITGVDAEKPLPKEYALEPNYPNPFNPSTTITFALPKADHVRLEVYNVIGQKVATLVDGDLAAGVHTMRFDGTRLGSGIYLYRMVAEKGNRSFVQKMILTK